MFKLRQISVLLAGSLLLTVPLVYAADTPASTTSTGTTTTTSGSATTNTASGKLVSQYSAFAGSDANAKALVTGLREGGDIALTSGGSGGSGGTATTFTPLTGKMGFGSINIALALAKAELAKQGITNPTPEQIKAALNGGSVTTSGGSATLSGILQLRSEGKGWGQIANSLGLKLGDIVSSSKTDKTQAGIQRTARTETAKSVAKNEHSRVSKPEKTERAEKNERPEKIERPQKVERPEKIERPQKVERPEKIERPQKVERPERVERAGRS